MFNWKKKKELIRKSNVRKVYEISEDERRTYDLHYKAIGDEPLTEEEVECIANKIKNKTYHDTVELASCIRTLRWAGAVQYRDLVEPFLYFPEQEFVAQEALKALCHWGLTREYLDTIKQFIRGVDWYGTGDVWTAAVSSAGKYLRTHIDRELLEMLLSAFEDEEVDPLDRACAFEALASAVGKHPSDKLSTSLSVESAIECHRFELLDMSVIEKSKQRLKDEFISLD